MPLEFIDPDKFVIVDAVNAGVAARFFLQNLKLLVGCVKFPKDTLLLGLVP